MYKTIDIIFQTFLKNRRISDNDINNFIHFFGKERIELESDNDSNSISSTKNTRFSSIEEIIEAIQQFLGSIFSSVEENLSLLRALFDKRIIYFLISNRDNGGGLLF